ncbi:hypothetical protein KL86DYS2_12969 [uncultured Dysgonomonas sp.]|uniref:Uncharacterized protein n=1 Tax=uncultured Dysgonomonas sp. TaxID=206096 RepID=A0A212K3X9_9BACT|nr:hypothetical protein KL86DYS2_12969 [uncultured Dysgonomonas sp.]
MEERPPRYTVLWECSKDKQTIKLILLWKKEKQQKQLITLWSTQRAFAQIGSLYANGSAKK